MGEAKKKKANKKGKVSNTKTNTKQHKKQTSRYCCKKGQTTPTFKGTSKSGKTIPVAFNPITNHAIITPSSVSIP